jgi:membrane fusion protein (multidrug efflux system)
MLDGHETMDARTEADGAQERDRLRTSNRQDQTARRTGTPDLAAAEQSQKATASAAPSAAPVSAKAPLGRRKKILAGALLALLAVGGYYGQYWFTTGRYIVSTDDAYVGVRSTTLSPKVAGYVTEILAADNATVKAGDVLMRIDDGDYKLAVETARDQVAVQQATVERMRRQIAAQEAAVEQARAQVTSAKAAAHRANLELKRQEDLATRQINSRQTLEQAQANAEQAEASVQSANAALDAAIANVDVIKAQQEEASRTLKQLQTALAKAERDLSFTALRAPFDGVLGNRAVQVGDYVQPTVRLATLVPLDQVYIDANFKETQLAALKPGQPVSIEVDALPGRHLEGRVASFAPASGSIFSLLPPDNATGNFTKVVQRLPVRILVPAAVADQAVLRPGLSVIVKVNTKPGAPASSEPMNTAALRRAE